MQLDQKNVLLGITGGIAAYKTPDLVRKLIAKGANVRVVMTESSTHFVSSLSLQAVSGNKVSTNLLDEDAEAGMGHIELARWADYFIIAPCTANTMAKLSFGLADDLLTTLALATQAKLFIAPAMNQQMWASDPTQTNLKLLEQRGVTFFGPAAGEQACGDVGYGRMLEPEEIADQLEQACTEHKSNELQGLNIMITAGPTQEAIDPVRYISNHSSGKMGYALAKAAKQLGANVTLVSGPVNLSKPDGVTKISVASAQQMYDEVHQHINEQDIFIACAAVADFRLENIGEHKMKKQNSETTMTLHLVQNPDILKSVADLDEPPFTCGFAAETQNVEKYAKNKLINKKLNMIAANDVSNQNLGFNSEQNALIVLTKGSKHQLSPQSKYSLSVELLKIINREYHSKS